MKKTMEEQKAELKEQINKEIDRYYEKMGEGLKEKTLKIDGIERMMKEKKAKLSEMLEEATSEAVGEDEAGQECKKKCPECGRPMRRQNSEQEIRIKTISGELRIKRTYCYCRQCRHGESPYDETIGIDALPYKMTKELMVETAFYGQNQSSFEGARQMIKRALGIDINEETIREVTEEVGRAVFDKDRQRAKETLENIHRIDASYQKEATLYIEMDGAAVNTRVEDENGSTWRENKTVMVFTDKDMIKRKDEGHIITKKEYMAYIGTSEDFKAFVLDAAVRAGYGKIKNVVVIADGATWIRNMCEEIFPDAVQILDLFHLKENIYDYAKYKYKGDASKYTPWAEVFIEKIENGETDEALAALPDNENFPAGTVNLKTYINNNRDKIRYSQYREAGYFVGSGAIESANKLIVQRRLKQAGMRWSVDGAQALLTLRSKVESNLWDDVVNFFAA